VHWSVGWLVQVRNPCAQVAPDPVKPVLTRAMLCELHCAPECPESAEQRSGSCPEIPDHEQWPEAAQKATKERMGRQLVRHAVEIGPPCHHCRCISSGSTCAWSSNCASTMFWLWLSTFSCSYKTQSVHVCDIRLNAGPLSRRL
jgi:hypothetical protein